jgi:plasmid stability protein
MHLEDTMPLLQVRNFPEDIYEQIKIEAESEHRTIAQQTIVLIKKSLSLEESNIERRRKLIEKCNARIIPEAAKAIDDAALIREDRER